MEGVVFGLILGLGLGLGGVFALVRMRKRDASGQEAAKTNIYTTIENMRSVGELSVFKVITKEIVTTKDHWAGRFGKRYLEWLMSSKKMAMIFEFDIDFRYDLRDPAMKILDEGEGRFRIRMPRCLYEIHIRDINFYDEQKARLLPWLFPELLTSVFGSGFDEEDRNKLKEEAKQKAYELAKNLVHTLRSEVQNSARQTVEALGKGFAAERVFVDFEDTEPVQLQVRYEVTADQRKPQEAAAAVEGKA
jgi:hypothetical protein